jgi:hypothetical protein
LTIIIWYVFGEHLFQHLWLLATHSVDFSLWQLSKLDAKSMGKKTHKKKNDPLIANLGFHANQRKLVKLE